MFNPIITTRIESLMITQPHLMNRLKRAVPILMLLTSFGYLIWNSLEHHFLCDDAYISFRYSENWARGHGLVFNLGERVEGYTNFLWVLLIGIMRSWFDASPITTSLTSSYILTWLTFGMVCYGAWQIPIGKKGNPWMVVMAALFFATNRNVAVWATSGLETRLFTALILLGLLFVSESERPRRQRTFLFLGSAMFGLAELTRPEAPLLFGTATGVYSLAMLTQYKVGWRGLIERWFPLFIPFTLIVASHYVWRYSYYGDWLPNTYYAKHVRSWPEAGWRYLLVATIEGGLYLSIPLAMLGAWLSLRKKKLFPVLGVAMLFPHALYISEIGGDHFEFRMLDFYWPILSIAAASGVILMRCPRWLKTSLFVTTLVYGIAFQITHDQAVAHHQSRRTARNLTVPLAEQVKSGWLGWLPGASALVEHYDPAQDYILKHGSGVRWVEHKFFQVLMRQLYSKYGDYAAQVFTKEDVTSFKWVGVLPFYTLPLTVIDEHGLTDAVIARTVVERDNDHRAMAHDRLPPPGYLVERGVNFTIEPVAPQLTIKENSWIYGIKLASGVWMNFTRVRDQKRFFERFGQPSSSPFELTAAFLSSRPSQSRVFTRGEMIVEHTRLGDFASGVGRWEFTGGDLKTTHTRNRRKPKGVIGRGYLDSYQSPAGDKSLLEVTSPLFTPQAGDYLVFLVGGGDSKELGVQLLCAGSEQGVWRGQRSIHVRLEVIPLTPWAGRSCQIIVFDRDQGAWGHIIADHFWIGRAQAKQE